MCRSHRAQARHCRSEFQSEFAEAAPSAAWGWQEYFMRGRGGPGGRGGFGGAGFGGHGFGAHGVEEDGGGFGVRRPLRFLAYKLDLDEKQVSELARILDELKTERAQTAVDDRRSLADFAEALSGEAFDAARATAAGDRRVVSAQRLRDAVAKALSQIHALLNPDQRGRLAYMIRTGVLGL
jgi:Spy/CpxP family protein refolding chaperone